MNSKTLSVTSTTQDASAKHTPGPWFWEYLSPNRTSYSVLKKPSAGIDGTELVIFGGSTKAEENEGNAKLIAAAPNLLEACKFALSSPDDEEAIRKLEAAILKAQGK